MRGVNALNKNLLILTDGSLGDEVNEVAASMGFFGRMEILGDDCLHSVEELSGEYSYAFPAFIDGALRERWFQQLKEWAYTIPTLVHRTAVVDSAATYYEGVVIGSGSKVSANSVVCCGCLIESDVVVGEGAYIDRFSFVGTGAVIEAHSIIPAYSAIESGSFVNRNDNLSFEEFVARALSDAHVTCEHK